MCANLSKVVPRFSMFGQLESFYTIQERFYILFFNEFIYRHLCFSDST